MTPIFTHDCKACTYKGTFWGYDIYHCDAGIFTRPGGSWLARVGNEPHEYISYPAEVFLTVLTQDTIGAYENGKSVSRPMEEHLVREDNRATLAIVKAIAIDHLKEYTQL